MRQLQGYYSKALLPKLGHERMRILASIEDREYVNFASLAVVAECKGVNHPIQPPELGWR